MSKMSAENALANSALSRMASDKTNTEKLMEKQIETIAISSVISIGLSTIISAATGNPAIGSALMMPLTQISNAVVSYYMS